MIKSIMVAKAANNVIGKDNGLVWHLPGDLKYFKKTTMGHWVIMGRKTFESFGNPLPGRPHVIISRNPDYKVNDHTLVKSLDEAFAHVENQNVDEVFVLGGGEIYKMAIEMVDRMYITEIHHSFEGDTYFPKVDLDIWQESRRESHQPDEKNKYSYDFVIYARKLVK